MSRPYKSAIVSFLTFFLFLLPSSATVSVTATLIDPAGAPVKVSFVRYELVRCGYNIPAVPSKPGSLVLKRIDLRPNASTGLASGVIYANNEATCGGSYSSLWHVTAYSDGNTPIAGDMDYQICSPSGDQSYCAASSGTWDLASAQPFTGTLPPPGFQAIFANPVFDQTIKQPTGTALKLYGTFDVTNANVVGLTVTPGVGSSIKINSLAPAGTSVNLNGTLPAAPASNSNVIWQKDALNPTNVSAYLPYSSTTVPGLMQLAGDFCSGSTAVAPQICSLHLTAALGFSAGGTGQTTRAGAFNALAPDTAIGGMIVGSGANTYQNVVAGTAAYCWISNGPGVLPSWQPCSALTGGVANSLTKWSSASTVAPASGITEIGSVFASTDDVNFGAAPSLKVPIGASIAPTVSGLIAYNSTANSYYVGVNGVGKILAYTSSNITGNAATSTASDHGPTQCAANNFATGVSTGWAANCAQPSTANLSDVANVVRTTASAVAGVFTYDFGLAAHTMPAVRGTTAAKPATCTVGEEYFSTDATPGQNKFFCTVTNTWTQQLNSGASGMSLSGSNAAAVAVPVDWSPSGTGNVALGAILNPWGSVFIGNAATNNIQLIGTATASRVATLPNNTGTIAELNLAQTWTALQTFADTKVTTLTSTNANPASAGIIRLTHSDLLEIRNTANSGNTVVLGMESGTDWIQLGISGTAGLKFPSAVSTNTVGGGLTIQPTANTGNGNGGNFSLFAGNGAGTGTNGDLILQSGAGGSGNVSLIQANSGIAVPMTNDGVTGTVLYEFVNNVSGKAMVTAAGSSIAPVGVCGEGCGLSGTARVYQVGTVPLLLDGAGTVGDLVGVSASSDGMGHDVGLSPAPGTIVKGSIVSLISGNLYNVMLSSGGQNTGSANGLVTNPSVSQTMQAVSPAVVGLTVVAPAGIGISTSIFEVQDPSLNNIFKVWKNPSGNYEVVMGTGASGSMLLNWIGSSSPPLSSTGFLRLGDTDCAYAYRKHDNTGDVTQCKDASDVVTLTGAANWKTVGQITSAAGTITSSTPGFNLTQTWNAGGVAFTGILANYTATAFATASKALDLQFAGTSFFNVATGAATSTGPVVNLAGTAPSIVSTGGSLAISPSGTNPVIFNNGTAANPAITFAASATAGFYSASATVIGVSTGGAARYALGGSGFNSIAANTIGFSPAADPTVAADTYLGRLGAASFVLGGANAASPVAYTINGQGSRPGTDSNVAGASLTIASGKGTGTGTPSTLAFTGPALGTAAGSGTQTQVKRRLINGTKALTSGAATTVASIPLATLQNTGGSVNYHLEATDGTNQCSTDGTINYSAENSAGVFVVNISTVGNAATACTVTKTLTVAWSMTSANPALLQVTPTLTGITATRFDIIYEASNFGVTDPTW